jgi:hypothetical protein
VLVLVAGDPSLAQSSAQQIRETTAFPRLEVRCAQRHTAEIDAAVRDNTCEYILFLDASVEPDGVDWLPAFLGFAQRESIAAVGGRILYADGRLRHIGLLLGVGGGVARAMHGHPGEAYGYFSSAIAVRNYSAVSGEWLMTRRALFLELGGLDRTLPWTGADVDYCLKARATGRRVVFTPEPQGRLRVGASPAPVSPDASTLSILRARHAAVFARDPYFNPNLDPRSDSYLPAFDSP